jgi:basic amino acid/polyamine antiporter, APA family
MAFPRMARAAAVAAQRAPVAAASPARTLSLRHAVAITVGIVVGAGIFRTPSLVAANAGGEGAAMLLWVLGGLISLAGALCYAELATAFPNAGGDYHFLTRAYGRRLGFLFAWSRASVIQTGSVALLAFVFGDYATQLLRLGEYSPAVYAAAVVVGLTALNVAGVRQGATTQALLTAVEILCLTPATLRAVSPTTTAAA